MGYSTDVEYLAEPVMDNGLRFKLEKGDAKNLHTFIIRSMQSFYVRKKFYKIEIGIIPNPIPRFEGLPAGENRLLNQEPEVRQQPGKGRRIGHIGICHYKRTDDVPKERADYVEAKEQKLFRMKKLQIKQPHRNPFSKNINKSRAP